MDEGTTSGAIFSDCRTWRYSLWRNWPLLSDRRLVFVGLNPSTAGEITNDHTITRCIGFAQRRGYGGIVMLNLFAYRTKSPAEMKKASDPVGPDNDRIIKLYIDKRHDIVAAWGVHGSYRDRDKAVITMVPQLFCLGLTKDGKPRHPLFLKNDAELILWQSSYHGEF
jgi:hypothetical protein